MYDPRQNRAVCELIVCVCVGLCVSNFHQARTYSAKYACTIINSVCLCAQWWYLWTLYNLQFVYINIDVCVYVYLTVFLWFLLRFFYFVIVVIAITEHMKWWNGRFPIYIHWPFSSFFLFKLSLFLFFGVDPNGFLIRYGLFILLLWNLLSILRIMMILFVSLAMITNAKWVFLHH